MVGIKKKDGRWIALVTYAQREIAKSAGFRWDRVQKVWYTLDPMIAAKLSDAPSVKAAIKSRAATAELSMAAAPIDNDPRIIDPPDGLEYLPFQKVGISFALDRRNILIGDEMGLGKTIMSIGLVNSDPSIVNVLVICPNSLKLNWQKELRKWLVRPLQCEVAYSNAFPDAFDVLIINYDICSRYEMRLREHSWDLLILDEATYIKNSHAQRTRAILGGPKTKTKPKTFPIAAGRRLYLSGTPLPNRPIEGWTLFHSLAPTVFDSWWNYATRYCGAYNNGFGLDTSGASNLDELRQKLRETIMIRRLKQDVLTELPPKRRMIVEVPPGAAARVVKKEITVYDNHVANIQKIRAEVQLAKAADDDSIYQKAVEKLRSATGAMFSEVSRLRHDTALAKVPFVVSFLKEQIEEGDEKIIVFCHHHDVIDNIMQAFPKIAVHLTGDDSVKERDEAVSRFQTDSSCRLFVGSIQAGGYGITLTASSHVVFAELDWVPGNVSQAEARAHRLGQQQMVLVQHIVFDESLDARMAKTLLKKQHIIDTALDRGIPKNTDLLLLGDDEEDAEENVSRKQIAVIAEALSPRAITKIHEGLRYLADLDDDHAAELNGVGFNKVDTIIGHALASENRLTPKQAAVGSRLLHKYRRQLPENMALQEGLDV